MKHPSTEQFSYLNTVKTKGHMILLCNRLIRNDMDVNGHERLFNITARHKVKEQHLYTYIVVLHYTVTVLSSTMSETHTITMSCLVVVFGA